jgi:hypothetical protein
LAGMTNLPGGAVVTPHFVIPGKRGPRPIV